MAGEQSAVIAYENVTAKELDTAVDRALKRFYLRPGYIFRFIFHNRGVWDLYRKLRGAWNFFAYLFRR